MAINRKTGFSAPLKLAGSRRYTSRYDVVFFSGNTAKFARAFITVGSIEGGFFHLHNQAAKNVTLVSSDLAQIALWCNEKATDTSGNVDGAAPTS